jgi:dienelactone hydrolase
MEKEAVLSRIYSNYDHGQFARILEDIEELAPEDRETGELSYIQLCMLSLLGREDEALSFLDDLAQRRIWLEPTLMMEDADLRSLRSSEEFRHLLTVHAEVKAEAPAAGTGTRVVYPEGKGPYPLLLVLHGNQQNAAETIDRWEKASEEGWMVAALESKQTGCGSGSFVWTDYREAREQVLEFMREYRSRVNGTVVLGGFSRGARTAINAALDGAVHTAGVMAVCPAELSKVPSWTVDVAAEPIRATVFLGAEDPYTRESEELERCLTQTGSEITYRVIDGMGHAYPENFSECLAGLMRKIPKA